MSSDGRRPTRGQTGTRRRCVKCSALLAADNTADMCGRCHRDQRDQLRTPPVHLRGDFWETEDFRAAFESQHIGLVLKAYRNHPRHLQMYGKALNQEVLGRWLGTTQFQISKLENGKPQENLGILRNYAALLHIPHHLLWFDFPGESRLALRANPATDESQESRSRLLVPNAGMDTLELLERIRNSDLNTSAVDALKITVEQLCCDYAHADARGLADAGRAWLGKTTELLNSRVSLGQHREILNTAGMLALLVGCVEFDLGDARAAEATRRMAIELGKESGDPSIVGWGHEMLAWFHLTSGNLRAVLAAADAGLTAAPSDSVAVQLYGQQAKAYARMGRADDVYTALEKGSELLSKLPFPERPDNHFVVDPDKWDFYAMDTYRIVGQDALAQRNAEEVIRRSTNTEGDLIAPMRHAEARLTLAVIAARSGDAEQATTLGLQALQGDRTSRPSLLMVASELEQELGALGEDAAADFREFLNEIRHTQR